MLLLNDTVLICVKQLFQLCNTFLQLFPDIRILHTDSVLCILERNRRGKNILFLRNGSVRGYEGLMRYQNHAMGIVNQRIACNPRFLLICLGKPAVDYEQSAICLDRALSLYHLNRNVSIHDMRAFRV